MSISEDASYHPSNSGVGGESFSQLINLQCYPLQPSVFQKGTIADIIEKGKFI